MRDSGDVTYSVRRAYVWDDTAPGGIGGLLESTVSGVHYDYLYDGRGNVASIIKYDSAANPPAYVEVAAYRYDGFGSVTSKYIATGFAEQSYRFSTKYTYANYGVVYYGYRFYVLPAMKWLTRDTIGEEGDLNLYLINKNNSIMHTDALGNYPDWNLFSPTYNEGKDYKWANEHIHQTKGLISVAGHGMPDYMTFDGPDFPSITYLGVAAYIETLDKWNCGERIVKLWSCWTGAGTFARNLSRRLHTTVIAPNNLFSVNYETGTYTILNGGRWVTFIDGSKSY